MIMNDLTCGIRNGGTSLCMTGLIFALLNYTDNTATPSEPWKVSLLTVTYLTFDRYRVLTKGRFIRRDSRATLRVFLERVRQSFKATKTNLTIWTSYIYLLKTELFSLNPNKASIFIWLTAFLLCSPFWFTAKVNRRGFTTWRKKSSDDLENKASCRIEWDSHLTEESCKKLWSNYNGTEEYKTCDIKQRIMADDKDCDYEHEFECVSSWWHLRVTVIGDKVTFIFIQNAPSRGEQKFWSYFVSFAVIIPIIIITISYFQLYKLLKVPPYHIGLIIS